MSAAIDHLKIYRLPWSYVDNIISWLEPTTACNLACKGCYRDTSSPKHKTLEEVRSDLEVFKSLRKSDCISITGGDPLCHPEIVEIVKMIKEMGWKPILNTNGLALKEPLLRELKKAGVYGFTFHIDTSQGRPGVDAATEVELNELRLHYAKMLAKAGGIACSFNLTISEKNLDGIPDIVRWAEKHANIVHSVAFLLFRSPVLSGDFDYYANGKKIKFVDTYKETEWGGSVPLYSPDVVEKIWEADPLYQPSAYLNGTANPKSFKWLLGNRIVLNGKSMGYVSPRFMEIAQALKHLFSGTYSGYEKPRTVSRGKLMSFFFALIDRHMRKIFWRIIGHTLMNPLNLFRRAWLQSFMIIQPINIEADGRQDMCDACPDITVHEGRLVWSCRLEEINEFGCFVTAVPKSKR